MRVGIKVSQGLAVLAILCVAATGYYWTHDDAFSEQGLLTANAEDLKHTIVSPHLETSIQDGEAVLWCGTFQLAWNDVCSLVGGGLHFADEPAMVAILNKRSFTKEAIDAESYVAVAGFVKDDVHGRIERQLQVTFHGQAAPHFVPPKGLTPRPQDIVAYSYLFKNLEFEVPFERIENPIRFAGDEISCFGIGEKPRETHLDMLEQLVILDYQDEDDFVIELRTKSPDDRVILAKTVPEATLGATVEAIEERTSPPEPIWPQYGDLLKVPRLNFDVTRDYNELRGKQLLANDPEVADDLMILSALQNVRFQFDEQGVRLRSEAHFIAGCSAGPVPPSTRHTMVFDKPFLIMLQRTDADMPYFALWVGDPELLVKAE